MSLRNRKSEIVPSIVLMAIAVGYLLVSLEYNTNDRAMPLGVAALAIFLLLLDILSVGEGRIGRNVRRVLQGSASQKVVPGLDGQAGLRHHPMREVAAFGWILGFLVLSVIFGFYVGIPVYVFCYLRFYATKPVVNSALTAVCLTGALYVMFELLLGYSVFSGIVSGDFL